VEDIGGGVQNGKKLKQFRLAARRVVVFPHFLADKPIDFESLMRLGP
jgi:NADH:ubiquinone oxidoreductase subunit F (NADH-binding)